MMKAAIIAAAAAAPLYLAQFGWLNRQDTFEPSNRLAGIGVDRAEMTELVLERRTQLMIDSQTFSILRDPRSLQGAERITSPRLSKIFDAASRQSGVPASLISAIAYLESWGEANAQSPAGPKGIMQIAAATARTMGLRMIYATRYKTTTQRRLVKRKKGKPVYQTRRVKVPYQVLVRDERMVPERAVPAAANYLARLESRHGRDWAVFAYHCGEGCLGSVRSIIDRSDISGKPVSVARAFFSASPARTRDLYEALDYHMERDYSPTYWVRVRRAEQLLELYRSDPRKFRAIYDEYRNRVNPSDRAPHRLAVWLKPEDLTFRTCEDLKRESGRTLVKAFDDPKYFGFALRRTGAGAIGADDPANREYYMQATPSVMGTIAYLAYETRRLHDAMKPRGEKFVPLEITALVQPREAEERAAGRHGSGKAESPAHCSGMVFDLNYGNLPPGQRRALEFILSDLGWDGYIGFVRDSTASNTMHVGASPTAREFFGRVYEEAVSRAKASD